MCKTFEHHCLRFCGNANSTTTAHVFALRYVSLGWPPSLKDSKAIARLSFAGVGFTAVKGFKRSGVKCLLVKSQLEAMMCKYEL